jgi:hypothetical protein
LPFSLKSCNEQIDECEEDVTPPTLYVSEYSYGSKCFKSLADASAFFITNSFVQDDCQLEVTVPTFTDFAPACEKSTGVISAADSCGNTARTTVMFPFDNAPPTVTVDGAKIPKVCFTSQAVAENAILQATTVSDVCTTDPRNIAVSISGFDKKCAASTATVKAVDLCENVQTGIYA